MLSSDKDPRVRMAALEALSPSEDSAAKEPENGAENGGENGYVYIFGLPYLFGRISINSEHDIVNVRLLSIAPPGALRPYFQEGYLAGTTDITTEYRTKTRLDFKNRLAKEHRFVVGGDYNVLYQDISESLTGNEEAAGGIFRVYGDWTFFGEQDKTSGSLIFKGENRSRLGTEIPPSGIGFDAGYLGIPGTLFNDNDWFLSNLYWEQVLFGKVGLVIGRLEPDSFIDVSGYANPFISFQNLSLLINNTIPLPDVGLGTTMGVAFQDQWAIKGGVYDANTLTVFGIRGRITF